MPPKGVLLLNLGTPDHCNRYSIKRYLKEFLMDPLVVDIPFLLRYLLVQGFILPIRSQKTTQAYEKIWTPQGSPLLVNSLAQQQALSEKLGDGYRVELGMRYGNPSIASAVEKLKSCCDISIIPLFPQYSVAATESALQKAYSCIQQQSFSTVRILKHFYNDPNYIASLCEKIKSTLHNRTIDCLLFSYHGLPERQIKKRGCPLCPSNQKCPTNKLRTDFCYRAQCYATSELIANTLALTPNDYSIGFQSRLGKTPWIQPYTDEVLIELAQQGKKYLAIVSPSFVSDCLETLEEINLGLRSQWLSLGGKSFTYIPCLNTDPHWIDALSVLATQKTTISAPDHNLSLSPILIENE